MITRYRAEDRSLHVDENGELMMYATHLAAVDAAVKAERERCVNWVYAFSVAGDQTPITIHALRSGE